MDQKKEVLKLVEKIAGVKIKKDLHCGLPGCMGILHQPKRPEKRL